MLRALRDREDAAGAHLAQRRFVVDFDLDAMLFQFLQPAWQTRRATGWTAARSPGHARN